VHVVGTEERLIIISHIFHIVSKSWTVYNQSWHSILLYFYQTFCTLIYRISIPHTSICVSNKWRKFILISNPNTSSFVSISSSNDWDLICTDKMRKSFSWLFFCLFSSTHARILQFVKIKLSNFRNKTTGSIPYVNFCL